MTLVELIVIFVVSSEIHHMASQFQVVSKRRVAEATGTIRPEVSIQADFAIGVDKLPVDIAIGSKAVCVNYYVKSRISRPARGEI